MNFDPYKDVDSNKVAQLQFEWKLCTYVYKSEAKGFLYGHVYEVNKETYDKVKTILTGKDEHNINTGDKVYVLPGHSLAQTRLKEHFKNNNANMTKNIEKATIIAGSNSFHETIDDYSQAKFADLMFHYGYSYHLKGGKSFTNASIERLFPNTEEGDEVKTDYTNTGNLMISPVVKNELGYDQSIQYESNKYYLTPTCMEIIYHILLGKLKIASDSIISNSANSGMKLEDPETYDIINNMLSSPSQKDKDMGVELLIHANLEGNIHYNVWRLAKKHYTTIVNFDRSKALNFFLETTNFYHLWGLDEESYIMEAKHNNKLTSEIMNDLIGGIFEENVSASENFNDDYFEMEIDKENFQWTIKIREQWMNILKPKEDGHK